MTGQAPRLLARALRPFSISISVSALFTLGLGTGLAQDSRHLAGSSRPALPAVEVRADTADSSNTRTVEDFTEYSYSVPAGDIGTFADLPVARTFSSRILALRLTIEAGAADDIGFVGSLQVTDSPPACSRVGRVQGPVDVSSQVRFAGNVAKFLLRAQENCCCTTGWGKATQDDRPNARFHWQVTLAAIPLPPPPPPPTLDAIDPQTSHLVESGRVTQDSDLLSAGDQVVHGAAADGVTQVLLRLSAPGPGTVEFSLADGVAPEDGGLSATGDELAASLAAPVVSTANGFKSFAIYRAPRAFNRGHDGDAEVGARSVDLQAIYSPADGSSPQSVSLLFKLVRPPLLFVHGLWSDRDTWQFLLASDGRFERTFADYRQTHASHFVDNRHVVPRFVREALRKLEREGIATTQVDIVAHSMGGILSRNSVAEQSFFGSSSFNAGTIHELLTLDTPHTGTPLANAIFPTRLVLSALAFVNHPIDQGAIEDLSQGSPAIQRIAATPVPSHALVGVGGAASDLGFGFVHNLLRFLNVTFDIFRGMENDQVVGRDSQQGGLPDSARTIFGGPEAVHDRVTQSNEYSGRLLQLLNSDPGGRDSSLFAQFPAVQSLAPSSAIFPHQQSADLMDGSLIDNGLTITAPAGGLAVASGATVHVVVAARNGFAPQKVLLLSSADSAEIDGPPFAADLHIPPETVGTIGLLAIGRDAGGNFSSSETVPLQVTPSARLVALQIVDHPVILFGNGDTRRLLVLGSYDDGVVRDLTDPATGTTYFSSDPTAVPAAADGTLTAPRSLGLGDPEIVVGITASNGGLSDSTEAVIVEPVEEQANHNPVADAGPDRSVECTSPSGAAVVLDGTASSDPDGDPLTFTWTGPFGQATGVTATVALPMGQQTITLKADDGKGGTATDSVQILVRDTTPPAVQQLTASPSQLWPPNHKMVPVTLQATAVDACDPHPACAISGVTANEPIDGASVVTGALTVNLRSERQGGGSGRVYSIAVQCRDVAGNASTATVTVTVPHDQGK